MPSTTGSGSARAAGLTMIVGDSATLYHAASPDNGQTIQKYGTRQGMAPDTLFIRAGGGVELFGR